MLENVNGSYVEYLDEELIEHWLALPPTFEVREGDSFGKLLVFLKSLVVTDSNMRFLIMVISKNLYKETLDTQFSQASFFSLGLSVDWKNDLAHLKSHIDVNNYIRANDLPTILSVMDNIRYLTLLTINSYKLYLPRNPVLVENGIRREFKNNLCYRISFSTQFSIMLEKINPWKDIEPNGY